MPDPVRLFALIRIVEDEYSFEYFIGVYTTRELAQTRADSIRYDDASRYVIEEITVDE